VKAANGRDNEDFSSPTGSREAVVADLSGALLR
jgi:hypothetical protein